MWIPASLWKSPGKKMQKYVHRSYNGALYYKIYHTKIYTYWYAKQSRILASAPTTAPFYINIQVQCWFIAVDLKNEKQRLLILDLFALSFLPFVLSVFKIFERIFFSWMLILDDYYWLLNTISTNFIVLDDVLVLWE